MKIYMVYIYIVCIYHIISYTFTYIIQLYLKRDLHQNWRRELAARFRTFDVLLPWLLEPCGTEAPPLRFIKAFRS